MYDELTYRIALQYQEQIGNVSIKKLINAFGSATAIFQQTHKQISNKGIRRNVPSLAITPKMEAQISRELEYMQKHDIHCCFYTDAHYPKKMKNCLDSPYLFYHKGDSDFNKAKSLSIVGTRNINQYGRDVVKQLVGELAQYNVSIVSGLAFGVDTVAHEQALEHNLHTIAVMGSGFSHIYPTVNHRLAERIVENRGALITEFPYNTLPDRPNFPQRNRIIAGISDATLVIESAKKGGSIITAMIAQTYNRDVFAVPGSIFDKSYEGCHELIRTNIAAIAFSGEHLAEMMGWNDTDKKPIQKELFIELSEDETVIVDVIQQQNKISIDEITCKCSQFTPSKIASLLLGLELKGVVSCLPGKVYQC
ncbi:MAG: DNA-processing protein DprA [Bacteroidales bacterium]|jgi:DNA processing protein|nr:DNA-processing protein DprA [Bacteroidales bacterium]